MVPPNLDGMFGGNLSCLSYTTSLASKWAKYLKILERKMQVIDLNCLFTEIGQQTLTVCFKVNLLVV